MRDAVLDGSQRRRHFSNDFSEVRARNAKTWGEECSRQKKQQVSPREEQAGCLGILVSRYGARVEQMRESRGKRARSLVTGHGKEVDFYSECGRF